MRPEPRVSLEARADIFESAVYYDEQRPNLGYEFMDEVEYAILRIRENPEQFPVVMDPGRRVLLRRFPYGIFYITGEEDEVIVAVVDLRRDPSTWKRRISQFQ